MRFNFEHLKKLLETANRNQKISIYELFIEGLMKELRKEPPIVWIEGAAYIKVKELLTNAGAS